MATIGAENLIRKYGSADAVAERWLEGRIPGFEAEFAPEVAGKVRLEAARMRIEMRAPKPSSFKRPVSSAPSPDHGGEFHALRDTDGKYMGLVSAETAADVVALLNRQ